MYEARSHYHQVLEDVVTYQEFDSLCSSTRVICSAPMSFFVSYGMLVVVTTTRII